MLVIDSWWWRPKNVGWLMMVLMVVGGCCWWVGQRVWTMTPLVFLGVFEQKKSEMLNGILTRNHSLKARCLCVFLVGLTNLMLTSWIIF